MNNNTPTTTLDWVLNKLSSSMRPLSLGALSTAYRNHHQTTHAEANRAVANAVDLLLQSQEITWNNGPGGHAMYTSSHRRLDKPSCYPAGDPDIYDFALAEVEEALALVDKTQAELETVLARLKEARRLMIGDS